MTKYRKHPIVSTPSRAMRAHDFRPAKAYYGYNSGGHWFDDDTLRWFRCRLGRWNYTPSGDFAFITSEQNTSPHYDYPRRYSVRVLVTRRKRGADVENIGPFNEMTRSQALQCFQALVAGRSVKRWARMGKA